MEIIKEDKYSIRITKVETKEIIDVFTYTYLLNKKQDMLKQKEVMIAKKDAELAKVDILIDECIKLGIKEKPTEEFPMQR